MRTVKRPAMVVLVCLLMAATAAAGVSSIHRGLRRIVGFTIVSSDSVAEVLEDRQGDKYIKLLSGAVFKADLMILDPLPASDVIVFGKRLPESLRRQYPNLPEALQYEYRLLIDDEVIEVTRVK
jgi:hypothetical protein